MMIYAEEYRKWNDNLMGSILTKQPPSLNYCSMCPVGTAGTYCTSEEAQCGTKRVDDLRRREEAESEKCAFAKP